MGFYPHGKGNPWRNQGCFLHPNILHLRSNFWTRIFHVCYRTMVMTCKSQVNSNSRRPVDGIITSLCYLVTCISFVIVQTLIRAQLNIFYMVRLGSAPLIWAMDHMQVILESPRFARFLWYTMGQWSSNHPTLNKAESKAPLNWPPCTQILMISFPYSSIHSYITCRPVHSSHISRWLVAAPLKIPCLLSWASSR